MSGRDGGSAGSEDVELPEGDASVLFFGFLDLGPGFKQVPTRLEATRLRGGDRIPDGMLGPSGYRLCVVLTNDSAYGPAIS